MKSMKAVAAVLMAAIMMTACGSAAGEPVTETEAAETEAAETGAVETEAAETEAAETEAAETEAAEAGSIDVTQGSAQAEAPAEDADEIKLADWGVETMKAASFAGDDKTLDEIFTACYSDGGWHGIVSKQGDISVFYDNALEGEEYVAVNFVIETDGSFALSNVTQGESMLEGADAESFLLDLRNSVQ